MKKCVVLILASLFFALGGCDSEAAPPEYPITEPHVYTIQPGTEEWKNMTTRERYASCHVSSEEAAMMTTAALAETVINYPYLINMYAYGKLATGIEFVCRYCPALVELLSRPDAVDALEQYKNTHEKYDDAGELDIARYNAEKLSDFIRAAGNTESGVYVPR